MYVRVVVNVLMMSGDTRLPPLRLLCETLDRADMSASLALRALWHDHMGMVYSGAYLRCLASRPQQTDYKLT
jgi:hypothetical protein